MDLYLILKLVHILAALLWAGGVGILSLLLLLTLRRGDDAATLGALSLMGLAGRTVFARAMPAAVATGLVLAWLGGWGFSAWVVLSALLSATSWLYVKRVLGPGGARIMAARAKGDTAGAMALARLQLRRLGADLAIKAAIIALMVLQPGWTDPLLLVPAAALLLGVTVLPDLPARARVARPA